ncbi:hypothetical protein FBU31_006665, partial [Coemansia sp. 'formosensis']
MPERLQLDGICNLVHLKCCIKGNAGQAIQLTRQNSSTLESLIIANDDMIDVCGLIRDSGGNMATYPRLLKLQLYGESNPPLSPRPVFPDLVPFPSLSNLIVDTHYPFGDDTLLRGNKATLKRLALKVDNFLMSMVRRYRVFAPESHPRLQHLTITQVDVEDLDVFDSRVEFIRFVLNISPRVAVLGLQMTFSCTEFLSAMTPRERYASIQTLSIPFTRLTIVDAIMLIKSLPLLTVLRTMYPAIGIVPANFTLYDGLPRDERGGLV